MYARGTEKTAQRIVCKFSLVDLAGSERLSDGEKTLERVEEAKYINKSLSALGNVIYSLKNKQFRQTCKFGSTTKKGHKFYKKHP